jgi:hypothetical protein
LDDIGINLLSLKEAVVDNNVIDLSRDIDGKVADFQAIANTRFNGPSSPAPGRGTAEAEGQKQPAPER